MPDSVSTSSPAATMADDVELSPRDEAAIAATTPEPQDEIVDAAQEGADRFMRTVQRWIDDAAAFAHSAVDKAASTAGPLVAKASGAAAGVSAGAGADGAAEAESWLSDARATVRSHPLAAVGVAALAGVVLSLLLSSRDETDPG